MRSSCGRLDAPDDGYRREVFDGALVLTAAPAWRHQDIVANHLGVLRGVAPNAFVVLPSSVWQIGGWYFGDSAGTRRRRLPRDRASRRGVYGDGKAALFSRSRRRLEGSVSSRFPI